MKRRLSRSDPKVWLVVVLIVTGAAVTPMFKHINFINDNADALYNFSYFYFLKKSFSEFHEFPFKNPYVGGGYPFFADPRDHSLNPLVVIPTVLTNEVVGVKVYILLMYIVGATGMFYLTAYIMGYTKSAALFSTLVLVLSGWSASRLLDGNFDELQYFFFPLILAFVVKSTRSRRINLWPALLFTIMIFDGKLFLPVTILFMLLFAVLKGVSGKGFNAAYLKYLFINIGISLPLAAVKIIPMYERVLKFTSRQITSYTDVRFALVPPQKLVYYLFDKSHFLRIYQSSWLFLGVVPIALAVIAFIKCWRKTGVWLAVLVVAVFLTMGIYSPVDLFKLLWYFPFFKSIEQPWKYFGFFIVFPIALAAGRSFFIFQNIKANTFRRLIIAVIILAGILPLFQNNIEIFSRIFRYRKSFPPANTFFQVKGVGIPRKDTSVPRRMEYFNMKQNVGTVDWHTPLPLAENAVPKYRIFPNNSFVPNKKYQGEVFFQKQRNFAKMQRLTTQKIFVKVRVTASDRLVINQNYDASWESNAGQCEMYNGLLSLPLTRTGDYEVRLKYVPKDFYLGLAISLITLLGIVVFLLKFH